MLNPFYQSCRRQWLGSGEGRDVISCFEFANLVFVMSPARLETARTVFGATWDFVWYTFWRTFFRKDDLEQRERRRCVHLIEALAP